MCICPEGKIGNVISVNSPRRIIQYIIINKTAKIFLTIKKSLKQNVFVSILTTENLLLVGLILFK